MADFIDIGDIADLIRKDITQPVEYDVPSFVPPNEIHADNRRNGLQDGFKHVPQPVPFDADFDDPETDDRADFTWIRNDR